MPEFPMVVSHAEMGCCVCVQQCPTDGNSDVLSLAWPRHWPNKHVQVQKEYGKRRI